MHSYTSIMTTFALIAAGTALHAEDYTVSRSVMLDASADEVWNVIGDFCDLDDWNPGITSCTLKSIDNGVHRIVTLQSGAEIVEKRIASEPGLSYTYRIVDSPLPLDKYTGTLSITRGAPVEVMWASRFSTDDPSLEAAIIGLYESGLAQLEAHFAK